MTIYYVGPGGNNANPGTSWANRKLTLNGAEDIPVAAGDTVYVGPGVYRETLTVDVSGSSGSPITFIGDYSGANTDGVGGVVRITGSDDDVAITRNNCIAITSKTYRTFQKFVFEATASHMISLLSAFANIIIDQCFFAGLKAINLAAIASSGAGQGSVLVSNSYFGPSQSIGVSLSHTATISDTGIVISNCIFDSLASGVLTSRVGGITVKNCTFLRQSLACVRVTTALAAGQTVTVNNCVAMLNTYGFWATVAGEIVENYNALWNSTERTNTNVGANSFSALSLFDSRWFFELANGGRMISPFDLASYSPIIDVAGTSPTSTDMRGTSVQGAQRELGALEYDSTLAVAGASGGSTVIVIED